MSKKIDRIGKSTIFPYIQYIDEEGNRYFINTTSRPWFYIFLTFRVFFPADAVMVDKDYIDTPYTGKKKKNGKIATGIIIGFSIALKSILDKFGSIEFESYSIAYICIVFVIVFGMFVCMHLNKKKVDKIEKFDEMQKVRINLKINKISLLRNFGFLLGLCGNVYIMYVLSKEFTLEILLAIFGSAIVCASFLFSQWLYLDFTSKDVIHETDL